MSGLQAELLSPIDTATLWPQLHRLGTEVVAVRTGESLLVRAGVAATGLTHLPRMPDSWEVVSLRLHREKDDGGVRALLDEAAVEIAWRGGPANAGGLTPPGSGGAGRLRRLHQRTALRPTARGSSDSTAVPCPSRSGGRKRSPSRNGALSMISLGPVHEFVRDEGGDLVGWCGLGSHEAHVLLYEAGGDLAGEALDVIGPHLGRSGTLIAADYQPALERAARERGYLPLGRRLVLGRRLSMLRRAEERAVLADTFPVPQ